MINSLQDTITLNNDVEMPGLGLGVFQIPDEDTAEVVASSIENGYRLIDTAQIYGNEAGLETSNTRMHGWAWKNYTLPERSRQLV